MFGQVAFLLWPASGHKTFPQDTHAPVTIENLPLDLWMILMENRDFRYSVELLVLFLQPLPRGANNLYFEQQHRLFFGGHCKRKVTGYVSLILITRLQQYLFLFIIHYFCIFLSLLCHCFSFEMKFSW